MSKGFGDFRGVETLKDRVCVDCNVEIGHAEEQLLRAGPTGLMRWLVMQNGSSANPFYRGSRGTAPIELKKPIPGTDNEILWEAKPGTSTVFPMRQLVVIDPQGERTPVAIPDSIRTAADFEALLNRKGLAGARIVEGWAQDNEIEWLQNLIPKGKTSSSLIWNTAEWPSANIRHSTPLEIKLDYFRGIAKIGFHYALQVFPNLIGSESEFGPIRSFIRDGIGGDNRIVDFCDQFIGNFLAGETPSRWLHVIMAEQSEKGVVARVQFFVGPELLPPCLVIRIGRNPSRVLLPRPRRMHLYTICKGEEAPAGYDGVVEEQHI